MSEEKDNVIPFPIAEPEFHQWECGGKVFWLATSGAVVCASCVELVETLCCGELVE